MSKNLYFCATGQLAAIFAERKGHMWREQEEKPGNLMRPVVFRAKTYALKAGIQTSAKPRSVMGRVRVMHNCSVWLSVWIFVFLQTATLAFWQLNLTEYIFAICKHIK